MPRVVRMLAHVETDLPRADVTHCYLHGAAALRSDLTRVRSVPDETDTHRCLTCSPARSRSSGPGLLGTSIGLACRRAGLDVVLSDVNPEHVRTASGLGCGPAEGPRRPPAARRRRRPSRPPGRGDRRRAGRLGRRRHRRGQHQVRAAAAPRRAMATAEALTRYVGSHPMAGSERSGPLAASAALFDGRPWAVTPHETSLPDGRRASSRRWWGSATRSPSTSPRPSTTGPSPASPTSRTCSRC